MSFVLLLFVRDGCDGIVDGGEEDTQHGRFNIVLFLGSCSTMLMIPIILLHPLLYMRDLTFFFPPQSQRLGDCRCWHYEFMLPNIAITIISSPPSAQEP